MMMIKVGLLIESSRGSGRALLQGVADYARHHGRWSFFWEPGGLERAWPKLRSLELDGIILRDVTMLEEVVRLRIPAVVVGHSHSEVPSLVNVVTDSPQIARLAADHLMGCGFKHFAYCGYGDSPQEKTSWSERRRKAFSKFIQAAGFAEPRWFSLAMHSLSAMSTEWEAQIQCLAEWLTTLPKPVGLLACNDDCAHVIMEACKGAGLEVPDAVGVIGVDNDEVVCGLANPPLSSVALNFEWAGYQSAHALAGLIQHRGHVPRDILVQPSRVVARRSTDFVATEELHLGKALRFIRDREGRPVSVSEVARAAGLSRRALEKRFRDSLSRSVLQEIRRVRTDKIAQLLLETDLPVARIADLLGFTDVQHVARYFRAGKQLSPAAYRKEFGGKRHLTTDAQNGDSFA